jgi:short-subunit dehydrogenase
LGGAEIVAIDLAESGAPERLVAEIGRRGFHVDTLINNAGFGLVGRFAALPLARQREMIDLNIGALAQLAHLVLPGMIDRQRGRILNVASTAAFQAGPGFAVYFATKAFVLSFSEALHQELKGQGIKVSALCPGPTATEFGEVAGYRGSVPDFVSADARSVCVAGLRGLDRNRAVVVPGLLNKATAQSSRFLPRALIRRVVARLKA